MDVPRAQRTSTGGPPGAVRAVVEIGAGLTLLGVGAVAAFLPVLPGWLFMIPGLVLLACWFRPVRSVVSWLAGRGVVVRMVGGVVDNDRARRLISRLMASSPARRAVDRAVRWELLHTMLARRAGGDHGWVTPTPEGELRSLSEVVSDPVIGIR